MNETDTPKESTVVEVEVSPETKAMVEEDEGLKNATETVKNETMALIEAIKTRAQSELHKAGNYTLETYLSSVKKAKTSLEEEHLFDPDRIENSLKLLQKDAEKNWENIVQQAQEFGDRLSEAAKAAWEILTAPRSQSDAESKDPK
ncbi:MAG: hypothetical protein J7545_20805 [Roseofilum sp. SBFL]|uniref:hypothetical protein n=1 Tax=unclassified Roseofilum TaxID=2620099 RepID=UPI001B1863AE|nr:MULTISPECIES: hypothetical protein [unclassified Roseofilum]MBP0012816.1 hypothetical protein [Roseofilum sp. SID3]MBP0025194.1 hypothetical protein [Roseofilum sp. SID2]MBP0039808.1 hypothetical protein [Roseofilum sp. SID1]MBP0044381.1 hypothetical protein [Roseofilum sp. SBFL]